MSASLHGEGELYYIKDSRTWWLLAVSALLSGGKYYPHPDLPEDYDTHQNIRTWTGRLELDLSYHRSLAWKLYLTASLNAMVSYGDVTHSRMNWADYRRGSAAWGASVSLEYYL